jgi:hypothetical protein
VSGFIPRERERREKRERGVLGEIGGNREGLFTLIKIPPPPPHLL